MEALSALRLQLEWGVDEALLPTPADRFRAAGGTAEPTPPEPATVEPPPRPTARAPSLASPEAARELARTGTTIAALAEALRRFDPDGLAATATALVWDASDNPAALALVGDVPGADEDRAGLPFAGPAGQLLDHMLASIGLGRADVMLAHLIPWRPPGGRPASQAEVATYLPFLHRQLVLRGARRLLLLGTGPVRALLGREATLVRARGGWREARDPDLAGPLPSLATFAPGQLLQRPDLKPGAWADLRLLRRTLVNK